MLGHLIDQGLSAWIDRKLDAYLPYDPSRTALLLVDVQHAFLSPDDPRADQLQNDLQFADNLERLVRACRRHGILVIHAPFRLPSADSSSGGDELPYIQRLRDLGIVDEQPGAADIPEALVTDADLVLPERRRLNVFYGTRLDEVLSDREKTHLLVAGSVANAGVDSTGRMGVELDYHVTFVSDCIAALDADDRSASIEHTFPRLAHEVLESDGIMTHIDSSESR